VPRFAGYNVNKKGNSSNEYCVGFVVRTLPHLV
jgi:hypothetical protein